MSACHRARELPRISSTPTETASAGRVRQIETGKARRLAARWLPSVRPALDEAYLALGGSREKQLPRL